MIGHAKNLAVVCTLLLLLLASGNGLGLPTDPADCAAVTCPRGWGCENGECYDTCRDIEILCTEGYECRDGECKDIDECSLLYFAPICEVGEYCVNEPGSYSCQEDLCVGVRCPPGQICDSKTGECEPEPVACTADAKECPDGSYVSRDPKNDCEFFPCPEIDCTRMLCEFPQMCDPKYGCIEPPRPDCAAVTCPRGWGCENGECYDTCRDIEILCTEGYECRDGECKDIDECSLLYFAPICEVGEYCVNEPGSYSCQEDLCVGVRCPPGQICDSKTGECEPEPVACTADAKECPDGSYVSRDPKNDCEFFPCPEEEDQVLCTADAKACSDGSYVGRDPKNGCAFFPCPEAECPCPGRCQNPSNGVCYDPQGCPRGGCAAFGLEGFACSDEAEEGCFCPAGTELCGEAEPVEEPEEGGCREECAGQCVNPHNGVCYDPQPCPSGGCGAQGLEVVACAAGAEGECFCAAGTELCGEEDRCALVRCAAGTACVDGECVPEEEDFCASKTCGPMEYCLDRKRKAVCRTNWCATIRCAAGFECVNKKNKGKCKRIRGDDGDGDDFERAMTAEELAAQPSTGAPQAPGPGLSSTGLALAVALPLCLLALAGVVAYRRRSGGAAGAGMEVAVKANDAAHADICIEMAQHAPTEMAQPQHEAGEVAQAAPAALTEVALVAPASQ